jgi:hypothetical protein
MHVCIYLLSGMLVPNQISAPWYESVDVHLLRGGDSGLGPYGSPSNRAWLHCRLPPVPLKEAASSHATRQRPTETFSPLRLRGTTDSCAVHRGAGSFGDSPRSRSTISAGDFFEQAQYIIQDNAKGLQRQPLAPCAAHSVTSAHSDSVLYSRHSSLNFASSLPSVPGRGLHADRD